MSAIGRRPRNVDTPRAAAILYGDWGTSKAYVLGIAFAIAGYASLPILLAMAALTAIVGLNYYWVCSHYPDGGGVYSAVRNRSRLVALIGALLLVADYLVTASLSVLEGFNYITHLMEHQFHFHLPHPVFWAIGLIALVGAVNWWGPHHSGSFAVVLAVPASIAAVSLALISLPYLGQMHVTHMEGGFFKSWGTFAGIVLALSGVEAVANMTGVMKADPQKDPNAPVTVKRVAGRAILIVAVEVVVLTVVLACAMHAVPNLTHSDADAMLGRMALYFGEQTFGHSLGVIFSTVVGLVMALLLFSAGNTAIIDMVAVMYMMANDREMPEAFSKLNRHGVPTLPLLVATAAPCLLLLLVSNVEGLAALYAIGVVGAITINLGGCATNSKLHLKPAVRACMGLTALVMLAIWITIGIEKHNAVIFAATILGLGLLARAFVQERRQSQAEQELRELIDASFHLDPPTAGEKRVLVALRGVTETLRFAIREAQLHNARLGVLFVREVNVALPTQPDIMQDEQALKIHAGVKAAVGNVPFDFLYRVGSSAAETIADAAEEYGADYLVLGASAEGALVKLLRGSVVSTIADRLPYDCKLLIFSWRSKAGVEVKKTTVAA